MNHVHNQSKQAGFTLVELSLSMAFIAMLLLAIALLTIQISSIYNKGLTIRAVNESGQLISRDIQQTLNTSKPSQVAFKIEAGGGRLCANNTVYAWNYAGSLTDGFRNFNRFQSAPDRDVRLVRFLGDDSYCIETGGGGYKLLPASDNNITELLKSGDNTLALHEFSVVESDVTGDDTQKMYNVIFRIASNDQDIIPSNGCEVPESSVDDEYCAVNEFDFTARGGNKGVSDVFGQ